MYRVVFTFEVDAGSVDEYLRLTREQIKPYWEEHGCEAYDTFANDAEPTKFLKIMIFKDADSMRRSLGLTKTEPECQRIIGLFRTYARNPQSATYVLRT